MEYKRTRLLLKDKLDIIQNKTILIIGLGGVGSYVLESLARMGIKNFILVDSDIIDITNINRQIYALHSTIGLPKVEVAKKRVLDINPNCNIKVYYKLLDEENTKDLFIDDIDYVVDACDTIKVKKELIRYCTKNNIKIITCCGTGNKLDPTKLSIMDIRKTSYDPIAKILRKMVRDEHINIKIPVICSSEEPIKCDTNQIGSVSFVPSTAGLLCTSYIVHDILGD